MKCWNWKAIKHYTALILLYITLAAVVTGLFWLVVFDYIVPETHKATEWQDYQIKHKCALVAYDLDKDLTHRQVKDKDGEIRAVLLTAGGTNVYLCDDNILYIYHP